MIIQPHRPLLSERHHLCIFHDLIPLPLCETFLYRVRNLPTKPGTDAPPPNNSLQLRPALPATHHRPQFPKRHYNTILLSLAFASHVASDAKHGSLESQWRYKNMPMPYDDAGALFGQARQSERHQGRVCHPQLWNLVVKRVQGVDGPGRAIRLLGRLARCGKPPRGGLQLLIEPPPARWAAQPAAVRRPPGGSASFQGVVWKESARFRRGGNRVRIEWRRLSYISRTKL